MKRWLFSTILGVALLWMNGCGENEEPQTPAMKCEAGKCGGGKCGDQ